MCNGQAVLTVELPGWYLRDSLYFDVWTLCFYLGCHREDVLIFHMYMQVLGHKVFSVLQGETAVPLVLLGLE